MNSREAEVQRLNKLSERVIGACIDIHRALGPGLLESAYEECLCHELALNHLAFERQRIIPVTYKGLRLESGYQADIIVENQLIIELKTVSELLPVHTAQLLTYLKMTDIKLGLLINFNVALLRTGIRRMVNDFPELSASFRLGDGKEGIRDEDYYTAEARRRRGK